MFPSGRFQYKRHDWCYMKKLTYEYLQKNYVELEKSTYEIAEETKTYPNKVRRALVSFGIPLRDKSQAQASALKNGRSEHPTKGKALSEDVKIKISDAMAESWEEMSENERKRRSEISKKNWEEMPLSRIERMQQAASFSVREAAIYGSKLEKFIFSGLKKKGYQVDFHKEFFVIDKNQHLDMYVPQLNTAIEIDGPTHFKDIWGKESLERQIKGDSKKTGFIISSGMKMIRIKNISGNSSNFYMRKMLKKTTDLLELIKQGAKENLFEIE